MSTELDLERLEARFEWFFTAILSLFIGLVSVILFLGVLNLSGINVQFEKIFQVGFVQPLLNINNLYQMIYHSSFLVLTGLAVAISFKAGLFNIGGQGQMVMGGVFSAIWAASIVPNYFQWLNIAYILPLLTILVGFLGGALWGFIPGFLKAKTGAHEVITTIMMNLIAASMIQYLIGTPSFSPFVDRSQASAYGQSEEVLSNARFSKLFPEVNGFLNSSIFLVLIIIIISQLILYRTKFGYQLRALGYNKEAAQAAGINTDRMTILALTLSGGIAGLAGTFYVMGTEPYRYIAGFEGTLGFDGIAVSLLAANSPIGIGIAALLFGFLRVSRSNLDYNESITIPPDLISVLQALIILFVAAPLLSQKIYSKIFGDKKDNEFSQLDTEFKSEEEISESKEPTQEDNQ